VFDFGMARELPRRGAGEDLSVFHLTQMTGTLRFMAPEVAMGLPYNEQCDVYSFALIVWEMLTCTRPYAKLQSEKVFVQKVFEQGQRPKTPTAATITTAPRTCPKIVVEACQDLLQGGWDANLSSRWTIHQMQATLESICTRLDEFSTLQQRHEQQHTTTTSNTKQFLGSRIMTIQRRMTATRTNSKNKTHLPLLSWPKKMFLLPCYKQQPHHMRGVQSGRSSTTREEENSFVENREKEDGDDDEVVF
jgi:serine/threonine protein kinase